MNTRTLSPLAAAALALLLAPGVRTSGQEAAFGAPDPGDETGAGKGCTAASRDCALVGHWDFDVSLGAGVRTDPVIHESDIPLVLIPHVSYYGERVFLEDLDVGFTLAESAASTLSLIASPGYDRVFFYRSDLQNLFVAGLPLGSSAQTAVGEPNVVPFPARPRPWTYLAGPEWTFKVHGISGQLDVLHEITGHNHGDEVRAALGVPLIRSVTALSADLGVTWKSAAIVNYYYGAPGIYEAGPTLDPFVKLALSRPLGGRWRLTAFVEYEHLGNAIADSPIVNARDVVTVFAGANYAF